MTTLSSDCHAAIATMWLPVTSQCEAPGGGLRRRVTVYSVQATPVFTGPAGGEMTTEKELLFSRGQCKIS